MGGKNKTSIFSERLKEALIFTGITQKSLCEKTGITKGALSCYVHGRYMPKQDALESIASALNVSEIWLKGYDVPMKEISKFDTSSHDHRDIFAINLRVLMNKSGISQKDIAKVIGVSAPTINEWVKGKKYPRIEKIERLAQYFGVSVSDLVSEPKSDAKAKEQKQSDKMEVLDIILRLHNDSNFLQVVEKLNEFNETQLVSIKQFLETFIK